jgi:hypothetical protein
MVVIDTFGQLYRSFGFDPLYIIATKITKMFFYAKLSNASV